MSKDWVPPGNITRSGIHRQSPKPGGCGIGWAQHPPGIGATGVWIEILKVEEDAASRVAVMRDLARLWVQSQPAISAYIAASVYDIHHAEDLVQEVAQVVAEKFADYDRIAVVHLVGAGHCPASAVEVLPFARAGSAWC